MRDKYHLHGPKEYIRKVLRSIDFWLLFRRIKDLPQFHSRNLKQFRLIEFGPGPTKLRSLKRRIFFDVSYVDAAAYGKMSNDLTIADLNQPGTASSLILQFSALDTQIPLIVFADHCLEHLDRSIVDSLLFTIMETNSVGVFRVPDVESKEGMHNYRSDSTHRTPFDPEHRNYLVSKGVAFHSWFRWYRKKDRSLQKSKARLSDEILILVS
jgi:hypothetical protein